MSALFQVRAALAGETVPLRHAILRPHQPIDEIALEADKPAGGRHFVAEQGGQVVGVVSIYPESPPQRAVDAAWRLRGMAVLESHRKLGAGRALVDACIVAARDAGGSLVWCNARVSAAGFYARCGFRTAGEPFDLPRIGPHYFMERAIGDAP